MSKLLTNTFLCAALTVSLTLSTPVTLLAQSTTPAPAPAAPAKTDKSDKMGKSDTKSDAKSAPDKMKMAKPLTPQQQKMKDCGGKWQDEKKAKGVSGKAAYKAFMSTCLKA